MDRFEPAFPLCFGYQSGQAGQLAGPPARTHPWGIQPAPVFQPARFSSQPADPHGALKTTPDPHRYVLSSPKNWIPNDSHKNGPDEQLPGLLWGC